MGKKFSLEGFLTDVENNRFIDNGEGLRWFPPNNQCSYCQHHPSAADYQTCPHKKPHEFGKLRSPQEYRRWQKRCPDHVTKPGFEKEDEALFEEHFPDEELPPKA